MLILPFAVLIGVTAGWAARGSWRALVDTRFWNPWFVVAVIGGQAALELPGLRNWPTHVRFVIIVLTYCLLGWWLVMNAYRASNGARLGFGIVGSGWVLNLLAIGLNGGMPVSGSALEQAGVSSSTSVVRGHLSKHVPMNNGTVLRSLGDTIPVAWFRSVVSPGDVLIAIGIGVLIVAAMRASGSAVDPLVPAPLAQLNEGD